MEEAYQCPNCGLPLLNNVNNVVCPQCGYRSARSGAGRTSKLKLCVITVAMLTVLGLGMFLVGVPSELRPVLRPVTVALVEIKDLLIGNDLDQLTKTGECRECNLSTANLTHADLNMANLTRADLTGANLIKADLSGAILTDARLARADLTDANLGRAWLSNANLTGAKLDGVIAANFTGALNVPEKYLKR